MPRKPRENVEGGVYHVYARGNAGVQVYLDDEDRHAYIRRLGQVTSSVRWRCLSYCLMDTHVHLLLETPQANLSNGMQRLHGGYAQAFNKRHSITGHLFQGRYGAVRALSTEQVWTTAAYIARNPVEASLCQQPAAWPWSSHRATLAGFGPSWLDSKRLLWYFGGGQDARTLYSDLFSPRDTSVTGV
jgi:putative transposase